MGHPLLCSLFSCCRQLPAVVGCGVEEYELEGDHLIVAATLRNNNHSIQTSAMIDTGAMGYGFIDENFVFQHNLPSYTLNPAQVLEVIDGCPIKSGQITHITKIFCQIQDYMETLSAFITKLVHFSLVLGFSWL